MSNKTKNEEMNEIILWVVCLKYNTPVEDVKTSTGKLYPDLRQCFAWIASNIEGATNAEIANALNCDQNAISGLIAIATRKIRSGERMAAIVDEYHEDVKEAKEMLKDYLRIKAAKRIRKF